MATASLLVVEPLMEAGTVPFAPPAEVHDDGPDFPPIVELPETDEQEKPSHIVTLQWHTDLDEVGAALKARELMQSAQNKGFKFKSLSVEDASERAVADFLASID